MVFESDMVVLSKNGMYVGKSYVNDGLFKLNVMTLKPKINNEASFSAYLLESFNLWHDRLGHFNFNSLRKLINMKHIPTFQIDLKYKCKTCVKAKTTRSSFQTIKRNTKPLDLIHSDICDFKSIQTRGGNKYVITFIDDYCYVYLLKNKYKALEKFILNKNEVENQLDRKIKELKE